jgi:putative hydrolase of the HAD superfamily
MEAMKALLIDFDGVIRLWDERAVSDIELDVGLPPGAVAKAAFLDELFLPAVLGKVKDDEWRDHVAHSLSMSFPAVDTRRAIERWSALPGRASDDVLAIVLEVRRRWPVVLVTNGTNRLGADLRSMGLLEEFDAVINSSVVGAVKPGPEIFEAALTAAKVSAAEAFFTDDNPRHVEGALVAGIRAAPFTSADELRRQLIDLGMLQR